jgi:hypothetical protein
MILTANFSRGRKGSGTSSPAAVSNGRITLVSVVERHRAIPLSYGVHVRGHHPVREGHGSVAFESLGERDTITWLAGFSELVRIESQPLTVFYELDGTRHRYTPDFRVDLAEVPFELECLGFGLRTYVEFKPTWAVPRARAELDRAFRAMKLAVKAPHILITEAELGVLSEESSHAA